MRTSEQHSPAGEHGRTDKSGHGKNWSGREALTSWRAETDELVRKRKESERARGMALTNWRAQMTRRVRTEEEFKRTRDTHFLGNTDGRLTWETEKPERARGTHHLESADGRSSQETEESELARGTHVLESTDE